MKHTKQALALLLVVTILSAFFLTGCEGTTTDVNNLEQSIEKATKDKLSEYVGTQLKDDYKFNADATEVTEIKNTEGNNYIATGVLGLKEAETDAERTADFTFEFEFINYVGQTTATFRELNLQFGDIH